MIYDILCRDFNNQEFVLKYDPLKCTIYDETGREVFPKSLHIDPKPPQRNNFNGMQFDSIRLLIGMKCNYNCKYCAEGTNGDRINNSNFNSISPNDVDKFLKNLEKSKRYHFAIVKTMKHIMATHLLNSLMKFLTIKKFNFSTKLCMTSIVLFLNIYFLFLNVILIICLTFLQFKTIL